MSNKIKFTKRAVEAIARPDKLITYHDTETPGLKLIVRPGGTRTFVVYRKIKGIPERIKLGNFPAMTVEQARRRASAVNAAIADGENPNSVKRAARSELTLNELFKTYLDDYAKKAKRSWGNDVYNYRNHLSHWGQRKLSTITRKEIRALHAKIGRNHPTQANRVLALIRVMFNRAINELDLFEGDNPAKGVKQFKEISRDRFLQAEELKRFFDSLAQEQNPIIRDFVLVSLLTGARRTNVLAMQWNQINFNRGEWLIPETKNGESQLVPLVDEVLQILLLIKESTQSDYVFPGTGKTGHLMEPRKGWSRIKQRAGIEDLRLHDLRRSLGSWQANTGASLSIIGKSLGHKSVSTTAIYARLSNDPVRESMEKATNAMMNAGRQKAVVIPMKKQK